MVRTRLSPWNGRGITTDDRGLATTELVVIFPALLLLTFLPIHVALFWHARQVTTLAAGEALDLAVVEGSTDAEVIDIAELVLDRSGQVTNVVITVDRPGPEEVRVRIQGQPRYRIFPGSWTVVSQTQGRIERFLTDGER